MKRPTIFLDMDGVIADFFQHVMSIYKLRLEDYKATKPWKYDVGSWVEEMMEIQPKEDAWSENSWFQKAIATHAKEALFWFTMPKYEWSDALVQVCQEYGDVRILTKPMEHPDCFSQKYMWIKKHYPKIPIIIAADKYLLAHPYRILIDDHDQTAAAFAQGGGHAICFPQPWNPYHKFSKPEEKLGITMNSIEFAIDIMAFEQEAHQQVQKGEILQCLQSKLLGKPSSN